MPGASQITESPNFGGSTHVVHKSRCNYGLREDVFKVMVGMDQ
ncbi:predicted protein [Botrytis cinerea T4]|uniref:Uncharacterized protein n=1 Tax=Botryotinia fuckeliana (strain T4) TaxID=999810 RepID=G2YI62_BOTF4|nr:predicted protein [Botrytis cinerea T4]